MPFSSGKARAKFAEIQIYAPGKTCGEREVESPFSLDVFGRDLEHS